MKANELMVGDLVLVTPIGKNAKVFDISSIDNEIGVFFTPADGDAFDLTEIEPIPLTEEMLKINGFDLISADYSDKTPYIAHYQIALRPYHNFSVTCFGDSIYVDLLDGKAEIAYVHYLQHYLRLIGLTELADNFKIK